MTSVQKPAFAGCPHCGGMHFNGSTCPRISAIEYWPDGTIKRVEYHPAAANPVISTHTGGVTP